MRSSLRLKCLFLITLFTLSVFILLINKHKTEQSIDYHRTDGSEKTSTLNPPKPKIELTVRLMLNKPRLLQNLFCDFLRSAVLFWTPNYGDILLILDEEDKRKKILN